jgi:uncharacterized protein YjbI with pentapeptide repeats
MTEIRNIYGKVIATGEGTVAEVVAANKANLREADLIEADLRWADLRRADLSGANLREANLSEANLRWADLRWADLRRANLSGANLREADLIEADLRRADLSGANLLIPPPMILLASLGEVSDALCLDLMRYDAANHPQPEKFLEWAKGGSCPYTGMRVLRAANFKEKPELINDDFLSLPVKSAYGLAKAYLAEKGAKAI